ncbi:hypothetical protein FQR65_LT02710 [Abscondita terminalis]|nr:hypothetical protein FQR65_LT02710 [Abscondita terminalis]
MNGKCTVAFLLVLAAYVNGNELGAPELACVDMVPQHGVDPKETSFPYSVSVNKDNIKQGDTVEITVSGDKEPDFKGFLLQVRDSKNKPVGTFIITSSHKSAKVLQCDSKNVAATHKSKDDKQTVVVEWKAPSNLSGKLTVYATVAKNGQEFWARKPTAEITVS